MSSPPLAPATWFAERTTNERFPFRIGIEQAGRLLFAVRAQAKWPGPGQRIYCVVEPALDADEYLELEERVPIASLTEVGRKLIVALDRPTRKRCEFLTVVKPDADGEGTTTHVFFRTQSGIRAHRSRRKLETGADASGLTIAVDSSERYPWTFPLAAVVRRKLPIGDYALLSGERTVAVVERKTLANLLSDLAAPQALHHQWADLALHPVAAVVVEAVLADFLDRRRLAKTGRRSLTRVTRALAELATLHPKLPMVFAGNRKLANLWCAEFFRATLARHQAPAIELVRESLARYDPDPDRPRLDEQIAECAVRGLTREWVVASLLQRFPDAPRSRVMRVLGRLRAEGKVERAGRGRTARWRVLDDEPRTRTIR
jgi:hypothetical protein